jgi:hypothetical protein
MSDRIIPLSVPTAIEFATLSSVEINLFLKLAKMFLRMLNEVTVLYAPVLMLLRLTYVVLPCRNMRYVNQLQALCI